MNAVLGRRSNGKCDDDTVRTARPGSRPATMADLVRIRWGCCAELGSSVRLVVKMEWLRANQLYPSGNATPPGVSALSARGKCKGLVSVSRMEGELGPPDDMVVNPMQGEEQGEDGCRWLSSYDGWMDGQEPG